VPNAQRVYEWLKAQDKWEGKEPFSMKPEWTAEFKVWRSPASTPTGLRLLTCLTVVPG